MGSPDERRGGGRPPRRARALAPLAVAIRTTAAGIVCLLATFVSARPTAAAPAPVAPEQEIAALLRSQTVRDRPTLEGRRLTVVSASRPITHGPTVLPVLAQAVDGRGRIWLRVRLPGRAMGATTPAAAGWIPASGARRSSTPWHIVVELAARRVLVYREGRRLRSYPAIVGARATPTPRGEYFVEESVRLAADRAGAPFALALSARSAVLQEFAGGPGQIALHGLDNIGGQLGSAVSHGCVRLANSSISWLAARIAPGVPVTVVY